MECGPGGAHSRPLGLNCLALLSSSIADWWLACKDIGHVHTTRTHVLQLPKSAEGSTFRLWGTLQRYLKRLAHAASRGGPIDKKLGRLCDGLDLRSGAAEHYSGGCKFEVQS
jgi:hypothetical protein